MRPSVGGMKPVIMRMVVDLPAPFGPRKPSTSPRSTLNEMPSTARLAPKLLTRPSIFIMAADYRRIGTLKSLLHWRIRHENCSLYFRGGGTGGFPGHRRAAVSGQAGAPHRAVRAGRGLGLHRALHRAAPVGLPPP